MPKPLPTSSTWATTPPSLALRTLLLTITPPPYTLPARLSILRAITAQSSSPIEHFRSLRHHPQTPLPNAIHAIVGSKDGADRLLKGSPYLLNPDGRLKVGVRNGDGEGDGEGYRVDVRHAYHAPAVAVKSHALFGGWKSQRGASPMEEVFRERVPEGIAREGVSGWAWDKPGERRAWFGEGRGEGTPWRIVRRERVGRGGEGEREGGSGGMGRRGTLREEEWEAGEEAVLDVEEMNRAEKVESPSIQTTKAPTSEMQEALRIAALRFGPDAETIERSEAESAAARVEAERIAALRAASMERTRQRMGLSSTPPSPSPSTHTPTHTPTPITATTPSPPPLPTSHYQQTNNTKDASQLETARLQMRSKKKRYTSWIAAREREDPRLKTKSKEERWALFWEEVERLRV